MKYIAILNIKTTNTWCIPYARTLGLGKKNAEYSPSIQVTVILLKIFRYEVSRNLHLHLHL